MNVLVIRLSALGDVAMTIPAIYSVAKTYPQHRFFIVTSAFMSRLFINPSSNVVVIPLAESKHHGIMGTLRLLRILSQMEIDAVADLHNVLRSWIADLFFLLKGKKVRMLHKDRHKRKAVLRHQDQAPPYTERFFDVFARLGLGSKPLFSSIFTTLPPLPLDLQKDGERWIGIAPFARYSNKIYPLEQMKVVVENISKSSSVRLFLFGSKGSEENILQSWIGSNPHIECVAGHYSLEEELALMAHLDAMVTMDSANMHLASLVGTRVFSIWGATTPVCGFMGWRQQGQDAIMSNSDCQPCTIAGSNNCHYGDFHCLKRISPETITDIINKL